MSYELFEWCVDAGDGTCMACEGSACFLCGANGCFRLDEEPCEHDVIERHQRPPKDNTDGIPEKEKEAAT